MDLSKRTEAFRQAIEVEITRHMKDFGNPDQYDVESFRSNLRTCFNKWDELIRNRIIDALADGQKHAPYAQEIDELVDLGALVFMIWERLTG